MLNVDWTINFGIANSNSEETLLSTSEIAFAYTQSLSMRRGLLRKYNFPSDGTFREIFTGPRDKELTGCVRCLQILHPKNTATDYWLSRWISQLFKMGLKRHVMRRSGGELIGLISRDVRTAAVQVLSSSTHDRRGEIGLAR